jgi:phage-related protein
LENDGTVKIGTDIDESGFKSGLSKLGGVAKTALKGTVAAIGGVATAATGAVTGLLALESATEEYRVAQGKLNTAFEAAGYGPETASKAYSDFYKILGDTDTATEASQLLAKLAENEEDVSTWTDIAAGVFGTFGDSLPIEGLIESANETAKVGQVTGNLADALNWAGISEDEFNEKLAECTSESERNQLIMDTLAATYDEASEAFYRNNEALIQARENQILLDDTLAQLGETVSRVKNNLLSEFLPSISSVVTAFNDLVNGVEGADEALSQAIGEMVTALVEKLPEFLSFGVDVLQAILQGIIDNLPTLLDGMVQVVGEIFNALVELAPSLLDAGLELLQYIADGIQKGIPALVEKLPEIISSISGYITENLPSILDTGADILISLIDGIVSAIPILMENLPQILTSIIDFIVENLPEIIGTGVKILTALVYGIISAIPSIVLALPDVVKAILDGFAQLPQMLFDIGANIIQGLIDGFLSMVGNVVDAIGSVIDAIFGTAEKEAEVHSPSKRGERLGKNIDQGIANGLEGNAASVKSAVSRLDVLSELERAMPNIERRVTLVNDGMVPGSVAATTVRETADTNKSGEVYGNSSQRVKLDIGFYPREASMFLRPYLRDEDRRSGTDLVE